MTGFFFRRWRSAHCVSLLRADDRGGGGFADLEEDGEAGLETFDAFARAGVSGDNVDETVLLRHIATATQLDFTFVFASADLDAVGDPPS